MSQAVRIIGALTALALGGMALGSVVFAHNGLNDPLSEGWLPMGDFTPPSGAGPVGNDNGTGLDAWATWDRKVTPGAAAFYLAPWGPWDADALSLGWTLRVKLRLPEVPAGPAPGFGFYADAVGWGLYPQIDPGNNLYGVMYDGANLPVLSVAIPGDAYGYHLYQWIYTPGIGADLFVDGVELLSDVPGAFMGVKELWWGCGGSTETGQGNYNWVQFEVVPEPGGWLLVAGISLLLFASFRRSAGS